MKGTPTVTLKKVGLPTPWHNAMTTKPKHKGWYQVRNKTLTHHRSKSLLFGHNRRYWNGQSWRVSSVFGTKLYETIFGKYPDHEWRGFTEKTNTHEVPSYMHRRSLHKGQ